MSTNEDSVIETGRRRRRHHSELFKAEAVGACQQAGVSVAAVALSRGLNANLLRRWVAQAERGNAAIAIRPTAPAESTDRAEDFVPIALPGHSPAPDAIRIEVRSKGRCVSIEWPASAAHECAVMLRELTR